MSTQLPPISEFTASTVTEAQFKSALTNLRAYLAGLLGTTGTPAAGRTALQALFHQHSQITATTTADATNIGRMLECHNTITVNLAAASTFGSGGAFAVRNAGAGTVAIDPDGTETIDGAATLALAPGESCICVSSGAAWFTAGRATQPPAGSGRRIVAQTTGTNQIDVTADILVLEDAIGATMRVRNVSVSALITTSGLGGLDNGAEAANTWYYMWVIATAGGVVGAVLSTSSTAPVMPAGYAFRALVSAVRNDGVSNFIGYRQVGSRVCLLPRQSVLGHGTATTETVVSLANVVPPIATDVELEAEVQLHRNGAATSDVQMHVRVLSGQTIGWVMVGHVGDGASSFSTAQSARTITVPNVGQQVLYLLNTSVGGPFGELRVTCFTLPGGGE